MSLIVVFTHSLPFSFCRSHHLTSISQHLRSECTISNNQLRSLTGLLPSSKLSPNSVLESDIQHPRHQLQPQDAASQLPANSHGVTEGILKTNQDNHLPSFVKLCIYSLFPLFICNLLIIINFLIFFFILSNV